MSSQNATKESADSLLASAEQSGDSSQFLQAVDLYEYLGDFSQARIALCKAMQSSKDSSFLSNCSQKLKTYQESMKGKEEFEEFSRLHKSLGLAEGSLWHVVSKFWLKTWEEHLLWESPHPGPISNADIIETHKDFFQDLRPNKAYTNTLLKPEVREKIDFEIVAKPAYSFLEKRYGSDDTVIKRWCISLTEDGSGLHIELRLKPIKILLLPPLPKQKKKFSTVHISRIETVLILKEKLLALMPERSVCEVRAWKTHDNPDLAVLFKSTKHTINGKILKENQMIEDCEIAEDDAIIVEFKQKNFEWILYRPGEICCFCKNSGNLQNCSSCKVVKYCSRACQITDYTNHKELCKRLKERDSSRKGIVGLQNLGNTCFMNSALQCVLHTHSLKEYFVSQEYKQHLNANNPLGTKGAALALVFAEIMENVWLGKEDVLSLWGFKKIISKFAPQFIGYEQHDAHELLTYLLTGLHEDLNKVRVKPYIEKPETGTLCDEEASSISWNWFLERNKSMVVDLMYGQLKSTLKCPACGNTSITFDPLLSLSVNIPNTQVRACTVLVILANNLVIKQDLEVLAGTSILRLKQILIEKFRLGNIALCYYNKLSIQGICDDYTDISDYLNKTFIGFECPLVLKNMIPIPIKIYISEGENTHIVTFTRLLFINSESSLKKLQKLIRKMIPGSNQVNFINTAKFSGIFNRTRTACDFCGSSSCTNCPLPSSSETLKAVSESMRNSEGPLMLEVLISPDNPFVETCNNIEEAEAILEHSFTDSKLTLRNCLEYSMRPETLDMHNEWYCSVCKKNVQALKTLQIYKLPKILIFHLMRFKNRGMHSQKISELVSFPVRGLSLDGLVLAKNSELYDLYAVCNHYGGIGGGHYTAFIGSEGKWYHMDDAVTTHVPEEEIVTSAAYVLFYKLRE